MSQGFHSLKYKDLETCFLPTTDQEVSDTEDLLNTVRKMVSSPNPLFLGRNANKYVVIKCIACGIQTNKTPHDVEIHLDGRKHKKQINKPWKVSQFGAKLLHYVSIHDEEWKTILFSIDPKKTPEPGGSNKATRPAGTPFGWFQKAFSYLFS